MTAKGGDRTTPEARRARRHRRRRIGQRLVVLGYVCAALACALGIRAVLGDGSGASASPVPPVTTATLFRPRPLPEGANPLVPTGAVPMASPGVAGMAQLSFETNAGSVTLAVPGGPLRPSTNAAPSVVVPRHVTLAEARQGVTGVYVVDPDDLPGDYALLLASTSGSISVGSVNGVRYFGENGTRWLPMVGPLAALNESLAELQFDPGPRGGTLVIMATDYGHGALAQARAASARLEVVA